MYDNKSLLETLQDEFVEMIKAFDNSVVRNYRLPDVPNLIQVIIGMRRTGKTVFMLQAIKCLLAQKVSQRSILYLRPLA